MSPGALWVFGIGALVVIALRILLKDRLLDLSALSFLRAPHNRLGFRRRTRKTVKLRTVSLAHESKDHVFDYLPEPARRKALRRARTLTERYGLQGLADQSTCEVFRHNLYVLDILDRSGAASALALVDRPRALDVGSQDFKYAAALHGWLRTHGQRAEAELCGLEIDGNVVYRDGLTRADFGHAYARAAGSGVRYETGDFLRYQAGPLDVVFFFYPFVLRYALLSWGLPLSEFAPEKQLAHAAQLLRPGGVLVIVNHTQEEAAEQARLLAASSDFEAVQQSPVSSKLVDYFEDATERVLTLAIRKEPAAGERLDAAVDDPMY